MSLLTVYTVYTQFENPEIKGRLEIQEGRHAAVVTGTALNPWQYRVFAEWLIEGAVRLSASLGLGQGYFAVFLALRLIQNAVIFGFVYIYFQKITYFDVIFYLAAVLLILKDLFVWLPVLMVAAAMNRETSGLIPFLAITTLPGIKDQRSKVFLILLSLVVWVGVFLALRALYPDRELFIPYGYQPGLPLLSYNLTLSSFELVVRFFSFAPLVGMLMYKDWAPVLKRFFITLIPV
ncbi:MAG: hypothetical protein IPJ47_11795 [Anaerolineales bacterium]|nr:hypothetical protein [Anaerolineales bacterium]